MSFPGENNCFRLGILQLHRHRCLPLSPEDCKVPWRKCRGNLLEKPCDVWFQTPVDYGWMENHHFWGGESSKNVCMYVRTYVCVYVYIYIYTYVYCTIYIYTHTSSTAQGGGGSFETYRRGWLLWITDRKVVGVVLFGVVAMVATVTSLTTPGCSVV